MPWTYRIDPDAGLLVVIGEGSITQTERIEAINGWLRDPEYRPGMNTLADFSDATSAPTMKELRELVALVERNAKRIGEKKLAVVATQGVTFGVARQLQALADSGPLDVSVFRDRRAAIGWLNRESA